MTSNSNDESVSVPDEVLYRLGLTTFSVRGGDEKLTDLLNSLNLRCQRNEENERNRIVIETEQNLRGIINVALKRHNHCIWLDAACLVSPTGKKLLLFGKSRAGKSTLSILFGLGEQWMVLSEDIVLIDTRNGEIVHFNSPYSIREGTLEKLDAIYRIRPPILDSEWVARAPMGDTSFFAPFDHVLLLELNVPPLEISINKLEPASVISLLMRNSNLLSQRGLIASFYRYLDGATCYKVTDGSVEERIDFLKRLCPQHSGSTTN